ncbi:MAG: hypothetical protein HKO95_03335 [Rhodobacteraceae bacterium]|jgi:hypothetical protein|nr:hypothetical protein [Alphaproteobacteria bacterium]NNK65751.1 hypothetical protein [Paracoccaceae bacterium]
MYSGWIGLGIIAGAVAASATLLSSGSLLLAFLAYSMTGTLSVLVAIAIVALRGAEEGLDAPDAPPEIAHAPIKRAA